MNALDAHTSWLYVVDRHVSDDAHASPDERGTRLAEWRTTHCRWPGVDSIGDYADTIAKHRGWCRVLLDEAARQRATTVSCTYADLVDECIARARWSDTPGSAEHDERLHDLLVACYLPDAPRERPTDHYALRREARAAMAERWAEVEREERAQAEEACRPPPNNPFAALAAHLEDH